MCNLNSCIDDNQKYSALKIDDTMRRNFLKGIGALPLAAVLANPEFAAAQALQMENITIPITNHKSAKFAVAKPAKSGKYPVVVLIHEWWGLNNQIKSVAMEFANLGFIALAIDLFDGVVAQNPGEATKLTGELNQELAREQCVAVIEYAKTMQGASGKVGVVGWCFGGGWSLNTAIATPVDACVIYYGRLAITTEQARALKAPILGHFGEKDASINAQMVQAFEKTLNEAGKTNYSHNWYLAGHGFANPTGANYNEPSAQLSWQRTTDFFKKHL